MRICVVFEVGASHALWLRVLQEPPWRCRKWQWVMSEANPIEPNKIKPKETKTYYIW